MGLLNIGAKTECQLRKKRIVHRQEWLAPPLQKLPMETPPAKAHNVISDVMKSSRNRRFWKATPKRLTCGVKITVPVSSTQKGPYRREMDECRGGWYDWLECFVGKGFIYVLPSIWKGRILARTLLICSCYLFCPPYLTCRDGFLRNDYCSEFTPRQNWSSVQRSKQRFAFEDSF